MHHVRLERFQRGDGLVVAIELGRRGKDDVVNEVSAAVVIVADERGSGRHALHDLDEPGVDAVRDQPIEHDLAKRVVADAADKNAGAAGSGRLIDEDARRAGGKRSGIGIHPAMASVLARTNEFDQEVADAADFRLAGHVNPTSRQSFWSL